MTLMDNLGTECHDGWDLSAVSRKPTQSCGGLGAGIQGVLFLALKTAPPKQGWSVYSVIQEWPGCPRITTQQQSGRDRVQGGGQALLRERPVVSLEGQFSHCACCLGLLWMDLRV